VSLVFRFVESPAFWRGFSFFGFGFLVFGGAGFGGYIRFCRRRGLRFRSYSGSLSKSAKVTKALLLPVWPRLRRGTFTPATLRGPAPNGHPCPCGALAASMPLVPLRVAGVKVPRRRSRQARSQTLGYLGSFQVTRRRRNSSDVRTNHLVSASKNVGCAKVLNATRQIKSRNRSRSISLTQSL
jgi:hypothetical protein